jgi:hypothetical protein
MEVIGLILDWGNGYFDCGISYFSFCPPTKFEAGLRQLFSKHFSNSGLTNHPIIRPYLTQILTAPKNNSQKFSSELSTHLLTMAVFNAGSEVNTGGEIPVQINRRRQNWLLFYYIIKEIFS